MICRVEVRRFGDAFLGPGQDSTASRSYSYGFSLQQSPRRILSAVERMPLPVGPIAFRIASGRHAILREILRTTAGSGNGKQITSTAIQGTKLLSMPPSALTKTSARS